MTEVTFHIIECTNNWGLDNRASTICINICMYIHVYVCICTYICVYAYVRTYVCMHMYICVHIIHDIAQSAV